MRDVPARISAFSAIAVMALCVTPASALNCARASTASEKAICADPAALAADADLGKAYGALLASAPAAQRATIVAAQVRWIERRDGACEDKTGVALSGCLKASTERRRAFLAAAPEAGPGAPGRLAPTFRVENGGRRKADVDLGLLVFVDPRSAGERAFNAEVAEFSKNIVEPKKDRPAEDQYAYDLKTRLVYASPRLVSAHLDRYQDTGGVHPNRYTANVNVDMRQGRALAFADLLDKAAAARVFGLCVDQVKTQKLDDGESAEDIGDLADLRKAVAEATGDLKAWSFGAEAATIDYDPYSVGAEGSFTCTIPYTTLRSLAKPDFPLP